jgi:hypothetical protein
MVLLYSEFLYQVYNLSADLFNFIIYILALFTLLNFRVFKEEYKWILIAIIGFALFEVLMSSVILLGITDNRFFNNPYAVFTILTIGIWYSKVINSKSINWIIVAIVSLFLLIMFYQIAIPTSPLRGFNNSIILFGLIIFMSFIVHRKLAKSPKIKNLKQEPLFWFNLSFLIYSLLKLIFKPITDAITPISDDLAFIMGTIKNLSDPIFYFLLAVGLYKLKSQTFRPIASLWP